MKKFWMISSRDPFEHGDALQFYQDCQSLADFGSDVTLFLVQNGVLPTRSSKYSDCLETLIEKGVAIYADCYSLEVRGIREEDMLPGIQKGELSLIIDQMADGTKVVWH